MFNLQRIDKGRLVIVPLFTLLLVMNISALVGNLEALQPISMVQIAALIHQALIAGFYFLLVVLYFIRTTAKSTTQSLNARIIAVVSAFLPFAIPFLGVPTDNPVTIFFAGVVTIFGFIMTIYSLGSLGRSFSIIPQARNLVQTGPYKFVRHPVYLGELIGIFGIVMTRLSTASVALFCVVAGSLIYRASEEEKHLAGIFPEYESYALKRARFIPGIF